MRVLIVRPWGRTAFEMGQYCRDAFLEIGHTAELFTYNDERVSSRLFFLKKIERGFTLKALFKKISDFRPELILVIKGNNVPISVISRIRKEFKIPAANYWIDDPYSVDVSNKISPHYDYFFTNDPDCIVTHKKSGCPNVGFLTFGCSPGLHRQVQIGPEEYKKYKSDVCFSGRVDEKRLKVLESLGEFDLKIWSPPVFYSLGKNYKIEKRELSPACPVYGKFTGHTVWGEELAKAYSVSKIVLNIHSPQPVPIMRDFEVTGCGAFLLTDSVRGLDSMFRPGEEIVCYKDPRELKEIIKFYLSHPLEREGIAKRGQERVNRDHTYARRMEEMLAFIGKNRAQ